MLNSSNYIKKKAVLAATRIIRKVPEMADEFIDKCEKILDEKHHGVLLSGLSLARDLIDINPNYKERF